MTGRRIGLLGGTFDPIHIGHLVAAVNVRHALALDVVLLVVANDPWQKADRAVTPAADRLAMAAAAAEGLPGVEVSAVEVERGGPSYTVDTVDAVRSREPGAEIFLVVGGDVAGDLDTWHRVDDLRAAVTLAVVTRPGFPAPSPPGWQVAAVEIPALDVSATDIRQRVAEGRPIDVLVPGPAIRVMRERGLYASTR